MGRRIVSGTYKPGDKLSSVRDLATDAEVNPNTMQKALAELERMGLVFTNRTSGKYITEDVDMIKEMRNTLAKEELNEFLERMKQLGFEKQETISFLIKAAEEEKQ
jgi:DNA-binding transcriptional regulator YhcF (GntR family)